MIFSIEPARDTIDRNESIKEQRQKLQVEKEGNDL